MRRAVLTAAFAALALSGCTGSHNPATVTTTQMVAPTQAGATPSATATPPDPGSVYVDVNDSQGDGEFVGALTDVTASTCGADGADWVGSGTITNPTQAAANYRVWVAFIGADGGTAGLVQVNVDGVAPGESGDYSAPMPYAGDASLSCVLRVERRAA